MLLSLPLFFHLACPLSSLFASSHLHYFSLGTHTALCVFQPAFWHSALQ